jgi:DNA (cytosine-5)-methyltransferase 1
MKKIKTGSDFSGVGAFDQALNRLGIEQDKLFACDMDKYARETYIHNYGKPDYYPTDVYGRVIPSQSLDIYMTSPPCQAFSLAGNRKGEDDDRGILFYNSHEFIQKNKPRYFIFENVKGLLSDDNGKTFQRWCAFLGGKSVNGNPVIFPMDEAVPYHIYYKVLNAKNFGVPQNRERIFIIGIRDDEDNTFRFPREEHLTKRLKDILEDNVDEKYYLSDKMLDSITYQKKGDEIANLNKGGERGSVYSEDSKVMTCLSATDYKQPKQIQVKSAVKKGYEEAFEGDSISLQPPGSETRRGRVGIQVAQTLDTGCQQAVILEYTRDSKGNVVKRHENEIANTVHTATGGGGNTDQFIKYETKIRRLTPRECFRLMDFDESFDFSVVSDTQAYKQAGNSIVVAVLEKIIDNLKL